jgi:isoaspartyl peptidase/L-asparaginase-like protein (Ntn-hydrolase superfamily)
MVHGGAGTPARRSKAVAEAARAAWRALDEGRSALDAAVAAAVVLEDDPAFNAGSGANIRMDGQTVQMDAAVMNERGDFGAVAVIERVKNPILVARAVLDSPHLILAGSGATRFARALGMPDFDPRTENSLQRYQALRKKMQDGSIDREWKGFDWKRHWNFSAPLSAVLPPSDTIGVVVCDGRGGFASAVSTGGTSTTLDGRVGDVPIPGAGAYAGPAGAVCATGWGEYIIRENLSRRVYDWMAAGLDPQEAVRRGLALFPAHVGVGLIAASAGGVAADSNTSMAWAGFLAGRELRADLPHGPAAGP